MEKIKQLETAKNDDEKIILLDEITSAIRKISLSNIFSSTVAKIVYLINAICASTYAFALIADPEEVAILQMNIPKFSDALEFINKWNTDLLHFIIFLIVFLFVIPIISSLIVRFVFMFIKISPYKIEGETMKEKSKQVYEFANKKYCSSVNYRASWPVSILVGINFAVYIITLFVKTYGFTNSDIVKLVFISAICGLIMFLISQILFLIIKPFIVFDSKISYFDISSLEDFWLANDPEEKKRREEAAAARAAAERAAAEREARKPKLTFHTRGISSANRLNVYVDGKSIKSFDGGNDVTITMETGYHTVQVQVYNDAAETAYTLEPFSENFEAYQSYDIDYN